MQESQSFHNRQPEYKEEALGPSFFPLGVTAFIFPMVTHY